MIEQLKERFYEWQEDHYPDVGYTHYHLCTWRGARLMQVVQVEEGFPFVVYDHDGFRLRDFDDLWAAMAYAWQQSVGRRNWFDHIGGD